MLLQSFLFYVIIVLYKQNKKLEIQENKIKEIIKQIKIEGGYNYLDLLINTKVQEIESRLDELKVVLINLLYLI